MQGKHCIHCIITLAIYYLFVFVVLPTCKVLNMSMSSTLGSNPRWKSQKSYLAGLNIEKRDETVRGTTCWPVCTLENPWNGS